MRSAARFGQNVPAETLHRVHCDRVKPEDQPYMSIAEVGAYLGVSRQNAWNRTRRSGFPKPIAILRSGAVWATPDVVNFKAVEVSRRHRPAPATRKPDRMDVFAFARERLAALGLPVESAARTCTLDKRRVSTSQHTGVASASNSTP